MKIERTPTIDVNLNLENLQDIKEALKGYQNSLPADDIRRVKETFVVLWTDMHNKKLELEKKIGIFKCSQCDAELDKDHPLYKRENARRRIRTSWLCRKCGAYEMEYGFL